jgi:hypothetical protein
MTSDATTCPGWEYEHIPGYSDVVFARAAALLGELRSGDRSGAASAEDSRPCHGVMFVGLTPQNCHYYAGNYRGCDEPCLRAYGVKIESDSRVGAAPDFVAGYMNHLGSMVRLGLKSLDSLDPNMPESDKLANFITFGCAIFEKFLAIHPYANGNGHAGRLILTAMLGRYGYWLKRFPIEPRPKNPLYADLISWSRSGYREALEDYVHDCLCEE